MTSRANGACSDADSASEQGARLVEDDAEDLLHLVEVLLVAYQRGRELDDRVAAVVRATVEALGEQLLGDETEQDPLALLGAERLLGGLVLDELDPVEVPVAADVADDRQVAQPLEGGAEARLVAADVLEDLLLLEDLEVLQRDRGRDRVAAERVAVGEHRALLEERLHQLVAGDHRAEWGVTGGDALGAGDHVRLVPVALRAEHVAEAAERADDLVGDEQHVVLVADLADPLEVSG